MTKLANLGHLSDFAVLGGLLNGTLVMSRKAVRVRSSALSDRLKYEEFSKIQGAATLSLGAFDTTDLLGEGFVHTIGAVPAYRGRPLLR